MTRLSRLALRLVGAALSLGFLLAMLAVSSANNDSIALDPPPVSSCWVFQHMVKSGGSTVRGMLEDWATENRVRTGEFSDKQWVRGEDFAREFVHDNYTVTYGEYAESLRRINTNIGNCKWVDPLCAHEVIDIDAADIATFAEHWGNYAVRQFVMPFLSADEIMASPPAQECRLQSETNGQRCCGWPYVKLKMDAPYLNDTSPPGSMRPVDEDALYPYLKIAQDRISTFAAVGIVEDFAGSLHLFDRALGLQDFDWVGRYDKLGSLNTVLPASQDSAARDLQRALTDPSIKKFIALDLLLYEHAVDVHERQMDQYGLFPGAPLGTNATVSDCVGSTASGGRAVAAGVGIVALCGLLILLWRSRSGLRKRLVAPGKTASRAVEYSAVRSEDVDRVSLCAS